MSSPSASAALAARAAFDADRTLPLAWRRDQLTALDRMLRVHAEDICNAIKTDLGRHEFETLTGDVMILLGEISVALANLETWTADEPVQTSSGKALIRKLPKGAALIIGAYNFPIQLLFGPMIGALAAGCSVVLKPSELTPTCSKLIETIVPTFMDREAIFVLVGGPEVTTSLLEQPVFGHIFYTGSGSIGRIVLQKAAQHLTTCTLELGGKSPVYIAPDADLTLAANRIAANKLLNTGQVCIAPDTVYCHADIVLKFIEALKVSLAKMTPEPAGFRMVNQRHFNRVHALLTEKHGGEVILGDVAKCRSDSFYIPFHVILNPSKASRMMKDEIFGPVLPIVVVSSVDQVIQESNHRDTPLAAYIFTQDMSLAQTFMSKLRAGGIAVNDCATHAFTPGLPFGGLRGSGAGSYHGEFGFLEFTHKQGVLIRTAPDMPMRFPPHTNKKVAAIMAMVKASL